MNNIKLEEFKEQIKGRKIAVLGIGISNIPAIKYLYSLGAKISARDKKEKLGDECSELTSLDIDFVLGDNYLENLEDYDYIFRSPGVRPFTFEIEKAVEVGTKLTSEIEMLIELAPCKVIGVTGSDGKTTTTTLISKFLEKAGYNVWLGGNIGKPIFSRLDEIQKDDIIVLELSSFQLMTVGKCPDISVITNISPNHLDYHRSFHEYIMAKSNIFMEQVNGNILVLNQDNEYTEEYLKLVDKKNILSDIRKFSVIDTVEKGVFLRNGYIVSNINKEIKTICEISKVKLVGIHNLANICAAASAVVDICGIEAIRDIITTFGGVEHRMELVRTLNEVKWYNDSIGTSPTRTIAGLVAFNQKVILIAGGYDKNIPYEPIGPHILNKVKLLILLGKTAPKIKAAVLDEAEKQNIDIDECLNIVEKNTLEECVSYAKSHSESGDIVVMSPASASFDMYKNFEERGDHFKHLVNEL